MSFFLSFQCSQGYHSNHISWHCLSSWNRWKECRKVSSHLRQNSAREFMKGEDGTYSQDLQADFTRLQSFSYNSCLCMTPLPLPTPLPAPPLLPPPAPSTFLFRSDNKPVWDLMEQSSEYSLFQSLKILGSFAVSVFPSLEYVCCICRQSLFLEKKLCMWYVAVLLPCSWCINAGLPLISHLHQCAGLYGLHASNTFLNFTAGKSVMEAMAWRWCFSW